jgi:hypothetical protein
MSKLEVGDYLDGCILSQVRPLSKFVRSVLPASHHARKDRFQVVRMLRISLTF